MGSQYRIFPIQRNNSTRRHSSHTQLQTLLVTLVTIIFFTIYHLCSRLRLGVSSSRLYVKLNEGIE